MAVTIGGLMLSTVLTSQAADKGDLELVSAKVASSPADAGSAEWNKAKEARFVLAGAGTFEGKNLDIAVKSVHTKDMVFYRLDWADKDKSMGKKQWTLKDGKWAKKKANEDRLGILFEINRINKFATKGCAVLCHNQSKNVKEWYFAVESNKEKGDLWHWKAVRSNPVGYTEDGYVIANPSKEPGKGRKRDAGNAKAKAKGNATKDKKMPAYMQDPAQKASIPGSLVASEAIQISDYSGIAEGTTIPGYMVNKNWTGSFADVKTIGIWKDGRWTVFMSRKLTTGNEDDTQFNTRKKYPFAVAVFDNSGDENSYNSEPLMMMFK